MHPFQFPRSHFLTFLPGWPPRKGWAPPRGRLLQAPYPRTESARTCPDERERTKFPPVITTAPIARVVLVAYWYRKLPRARGGYGISPGRLYAWLDISMVSFQSTINSCLYH